MKLVISDAKTGKTYQVEIPKDKEAGVVGRKIKEVIEGAIGGADGYKLKLTGGSDKDGFPMRRDVSGGRKAYIILSNKPGFRSTESGERKRKTVRGNIFTAETIQVNTMVSEYGPKPLDELFPKKAEGKEEKK